MTHSDSTRQSPKRTASITSSSARVRRAARSRRGWPKAPPRRALRCWRQARRAPRCSATCRSASRCSCRYRSARNYGYQTVPQPGFGGRRGYQPRGRGLGGSSLINAMIYVRGQPEDYDSWAAEGCAGWGWSDVLPYFKRAEDNARGADAWHGVGGPLACQRRQLSQSRGRGFHSGGGAGGLRAQSRFQRCTAGGRRALSIVPARWAALQRGARLSRSRAVPAQTRRRSPIVARDRSCSRAAERSASSVRRRGGCGRFARAERSSSARARSARRNC